MDKASVRPRVIGITGHARSGKTTATEHLRTNHGAIVFVNSVPIGEIINVVGGRRDRQTYSTLTTALLNVFGRDFLAHHWLRTIDQSPKERFYVVDGIRYVEELETYRKVTDFYLIGIRSDDKYRFHRSQRAPDSEKDHGQTYKDFLAQKLKLNESFIDKITSQADFVVENDGSIDHFLSLIDSAIKHLECPSNPATNVSNPLPKQ